MRTLSDIIVPSTLVYILAHIRQGPYYINVARDVKAIDLRLMTLHSRRNATGEPDQAIYDPLLLVWHEACGSEAAARARMAEIRAWPRSWQRRLIESQNPYWLEQSTLLFRLPWTGVRACCYVVPETVPEAPVRRGIGHLPVATIQYWCEKGLAWRETIEARMPVVPVMRRYSIPVYTIDRVAREVVKQGLFTHGMAVLDAPSAIVEETAQMISLDRYRVDPEGIGFVFHRRFDSPQGGSINYCTCIADVGESEFEVEQTLALAATRSWMLAGKPSQHVADLEINTQVDTGHATTRNACAGLIDEACSASSSRGAAYVTHESGSPDE